MAAKPKIQQGPSLDMATLMTDFPILREKVLQKRPILREILQKRGYKTLASYAADYLEVNVNDPIKERQQELFAVVHDHVRKFFGDQVATEVVEQLRQYYFVSTADHHGPVTHPFFLNSNLIMALAETAIGRKPPKYVLAFSTSNIYMNNSSLPRGMLFHAWGKDGLILHRLSFFGKQSRSSIVWNYPPYGVKEVDEIREDLRKTKQKGEISADIEKKLLSMLDEVYATPQVLGNTSYIDQISRTNFDLWSRFFSSSKRDVPRLVYLEQKSLVADILLRFHVDQDTPLHHILFNPSYGFYLRNYFEGIQGSFTDAGERGTFLFWALPKGDSHRCSLRFEQGKLITEDNSWSIPMTPEAVRKALEERKLVPGLLLSYFVLSMYYGLKCLGGFNQVNYLTQIKNGFIKMNTDIGDYHSVEACSRSQTKELCDGLTIAFAKDPVGQLVPATGLDMMLYGNENTWGCLQKMMRNITLEEALSPLLPDIYRISYPEDKWDPDLIKITNQDVFRFTRLDKKIVPCIEIKG